MTGYTPRERYDRGDPPRDAEDARLYAEYDACGQKAEVAS